jgi:phospholipid transport system substrate-binding protein
MLNSRLFARLAALLLFVAPAAFAQPSAEVESLLKERDREIKAILGPSGDVSAERQAELRDVVNGVIDFHRMAEAALGSHWADLSTEQRDRFVAAFAGTVRAQSLANLDLYRAAVAYEGVEIDGRTATATTRATRDKVSSVVTYDLYRTADGWRVVDFAIDDVSTVEGYKRSFDRVIRKHDFARLLASLEKRAARG